MKATVMESKNGKSVILTEDGMFRSVNGNYSVGWEFDYKIPVARNRKMTSRIAAAAACLFMMLSMGTYSYQNLMVYATVTLHGTAPIQLELNRQDKVIGVKAIDESGEALAAQLLDSGIKGAKIEDAVAKAEQMIKAQEKDNVMNVLPQVQCKSADKMKALSDILRQEEQTASSQEADPTTAPSSTTAPSTTSDPEKTTDISAQSGDPEEGSTEASTTTQPSSSEGAPAQEDPTDISSQEDPSDADAQEEPADMGAQEVEADAAPADTPAPADTDAGDAPAPADDPAEVQLDDVAVEE